MAQGIRTAISIVDGLTPSLRSMTDSLNSVISTFDKLHRTADRPFDVAVNINQATMAQNNLNNSARGGVGLFSSLKNQILGLVAAYATFQTASSTIEMTDTITNINSRLDLMKDKFNTVDSLQKKIMNSANNTLSSYKDMADTVGKLGTLAPDAFSNNDDIINFSEQINKLFTIAGASNEGKSAVMLQLTQALSSGVLRGEEFNSVLANAPTIANAIANALGVNIGELRKMASEGQLTADVVKNSIYKMADETNAKFDQMSVTFGDVWNLFKNKSIEAFMPLFDYLREIGNSQEFKALMSNIASSFSVVANVIVGTFKLLGAVGSFVAENWRYVAPLIFGVLAPLIAYRTALIAVWTWQKIIAGATLIWKGIQFAIGVAQVALMMFTGSQRAATAATFLFNSAWLACPVTWILLAIVAVLGIVIGLVFYFADSWQDAVGIIAGSISVFGAYVINQFGFIYNGIASVAEFFTNVWTNPIFSVKKLFANLTTNLLDMCISMTKGWDGFVTSIANGMIDAVNVALGWWNKLIDALPEAVTDSLGLGKVTTIKQRVSITSDLENIKKGINDWVGEKPSDYWEAPKFEAINLSDAYSVGDKFGTSKANELSGLMNTSGITGSKGSAELLANAGNSNGKLGEIANNTKATANNTGSYEEELKYMRDIAEREAINRFTTAEIKIGMTNNNTINKDMDIDGVINVLTDKLYESMTVAAEGEHY